MDATLSLHKPGLLRLNAAARLVGMPPEALAALCKAGDIPVELLTLGRRGLRYVRASELGAFLHGRQRSEPPCV